MSNDIKINLTDALGNSHEILAPIDMSLNLMEVCKLNNIDIDGTCGGMAMCASCHCYVLSSHKLPEKSEDEKAMLSEAFHVKNNSRLGCQIFVNSKLEGLENELPPN